MSVWNQEITKAPSIKGTKIFPPGGGAEYRQNWKLWFIWSTGLTYKQVQVVYSIQYIHHMNGIQRYCTTVLYNKLIIPFCFALISMCKQDIKVVCIIDKKI